MPQSEMTLASPSSVPRAVFGRVYVATVFVAGLAVAGVSLYQLDKHPIGYDWLTLAVLTVASGAFAIRLPAIPATISVSETFVFMLVLLYGAAPATITVALDGLVVTFFRRNRELKRIAFNLAEPAVSIWVASQVFTGLVGGGPLDLQTIRPGALILPMCLLSTVYFLLNSGLTAIAVTSETGTPPYVVWRTHFMWLSLSYFGGASIALLLVLKSGDLSLRDLGVVLPLLVITYLTFKTSMARVEDTKRHLGALNKLYLSTVETLAMAIDAKDQITHGHIRRVQTYAVALARALGVNDEAQIKAIESAALLHDMGKLAVPEHILNKPGKLTAAEYEKMKLHAPVGADILSAIEFPYPVVPIVRHHHENWDGTGYPDRLAGLDIPIGARILAVVDCFDALTSDRPYRPALSDAQAFEIIEERKGRMYDPLVVDAFRRVHEEVGATVLSPGVSQHALSHIARSAVEDHDRRQQAWPALTAPTSADETLWLCELWESMASRTAFGDAAEIVARHLRRMTPANLVAFYRYDPDRDEIVLCEAAGFGEEFVEGIRLAVGDGLSGWVAAHRETIANSDPTFDLQDRGARFTPPLESALSTPLIVSGSLVGVMTLYAFRRNAFTDAHRRSVQLLSGQIALALREAALYEWNRAVEFSDPVTGLPNARRLDRLLNSPGVLERHLDGSFGFVGFSVEPPAHGPIDAHATIFRLAQAVGGALRPTDVAFRSGEFEVVVLVLDDASRRGDEIVEHVRSSFADAGGGSFRSACAFKPADGRTLHTLRLAVQKRLRPSRDAESVAHPIVPDVHARPSAVAFKPTRVEPLPVRPR
ncbi:MAG: HD domain-containing protein [Acidobacteria bacterium]|nr:HD domain-containing protein [Acidobacteriota bacterium]